MFVSVILSHSASRKVLIWCYESVRFPLPDVVLPLLLTGLFTH